MKITEVNIIGNRIRFYREKARYSQEELANKVNRTTSAICRYEKGNRLPRIVCLRNIAKVLDVTYEDLVGECR